jgi:hypothetical protein
MLTSSNNSDEQRGYMEVISYPSGAKAFFLREPITPELVKNMANYGVTRLVIRRYQEWTSNSLSHLNEFITSLYVEDRDTPAFIINSLTNLEELSLSHVSSEINFSLFSNLRECYLNKFKELPRELESCTQLKVLKLATSKIKSFSHLANYQYLQDLELNGITVDSLHSINLLSHLQTLTINRSQYQNLSFLENCTNLKELNLSLFSKLEDLHHLKNLSHLEKLHLESCPILKDISPIELLCQLRSLALVNCPKIKSVKHLLKLNNLNAILLWESTKIEDGDIRCLLSLPHLKRLSFLNRRNYNLKIEEVAYILK